MRYVLLFLIIFSLRIPYFYNSVIFSLFILLIYGSYLQKLRLSKDIIILLILQIVFFLISIILPTIFSTYDYTFSKNILSVIILTLTLNLYFNIFFDKIKTIDHAKKIFVNIFIIQSIWIISVIVFPDLQIVNAAFQDQIVSSTVQDYESQRGFALTFSPFFGVSVLFAFALFLFFNINNVKNAKISFINLIYFSLLFICGSTSGRTFLIGAIIIVFFNILNDIVNRRIFTIKILLILLFFIYILSILTSYFNLDVIDSVYNKILPFAFEIFYNYFINGNFSTTSSNDTLQMYYPITGDTLFFGDVKYSYDQYFYYGDTDSGYMRPILFFGLFGFIPWVFYFLYIIFYVVKRTKISLMLIPTLLTFIFALKGETIGYPSYLNVFFIYFYVYLTQKSRI